MFLSPPCPKSHVPVGVRRSSNGEEFGTVPGPNRSSRFPGQPVKRGHLEATTVRAFLVSAGFPTAGVTEEAHLHCRTCGGTTLQSKADEQAFARSGRWPSSR